MRPHVLSLTLAAAAAVAAAPPLAEPLDGPASSPGPAMVAPPALPADWRTIAGSMPLSTLRAKIDYGFCEAPTAQGNIGVQVWVNQGTYEESGDGADAQEGQAPKKPKRSYKR